MKKIALIFTTILVLLSVLFNFISCTELLTASTDDSSISEYESTGKKETTKKDEETTKNSSSDKNNVTTEKETAKATEKATENVSQSTVYILNTNSKKIHYSSCSAAKKISSENRRESTESIEALIANGYTRCGICMK